MVFITFFRPYRVVLVDDLINICGQGSMTCWQGYHYCVVASFYGGTANCFGSLALITFR